MIRQLLASPRMKAPIPMKWVNRAPGHRGDRNVARWCESPMLSLILKLLELGL